MSCGSVATSSPTASVIPPSSAGPRSRAFPAHSLSKAADPPPGGWPRHPNHAGAPRSPRRINDDDLHSRSERGSSRGARPQRPSARLGSSPRHISGPTGYATAPIPARARRAQPVKRVARREERPHALLRAAFAAHEGHEVDTQGDSFFVVFRRATHAVAAAVASQRALAAAAWPDGGAVRVRIGMHTGEPIRTAAGYTGLDVIRGARIKEAGHGGQILLSKPTAALIEDALIGGLGLRDLGARHAISSPHGETRSQPFQYLVAGRTIGCTRRAAERPAGDPQR